jgi:hypothetical protein
MRADNLRERLTGRLIPVRTTERDELCERFATRRVWTVHEGEAVEDRNWVGTRCGRRSTALGNIISPSPSWLSWFVAQTKFEWAQHYPRDPALRSQFNTEVLPALSVANVRELLRAVMPLKQLTEEQAPERVIEHLLNRTRLRKSRIKKQRLMKNATFGLT